MNGRPTPSASRWRAVAAVLAVWALTATGWSVWRGLDRGLELDSVEPIARAKARTGVRQLRAASFEELPGWSRDPVSEAIPAFLRSCSALERLPADRGVEPVAVGGRAGDWQPVCAAAAELRDEEDDAVRRFFEARFRPLRVLDGRAGAGLVTGYYEPLLRGSRRRQGKYVVPLYRRPPELVSIELGEFRERLAGERLAGRLAGSRLLPFASRAEIVAGAMAGRGLELVWVDDPVDAFFLHIQGSGTIRFENGAHMRVGYAGQNGHPYYAIGRELVERGALELEEVSMQSIRRWLELHPEAAAEVMARNASYVFFRRLEGEGPLGSLGVPLTAGRSVAVDRRYLPLGVPLWLDTRAPPVEEGEGDANRVVQRLVVAQDTGGAIRGAVRADLFWGAGREAGEIAGRMRHRGRYWVLLPKPLAEQALRRAGSS